ncbi:MAG: hypothetical protein ACOY0T_31780 [Myxococcota bacterium]
MKLRTLLGSALPCALLLCLAACEKKEQPAAEATPSVVPPPAVPAPAPAAEIAESDLAVSEDFEDDAEKEISASNYKAELSSLEKELESPE